MEIQSESNEDIKEMRSHLESRIQNLQSSHLGVIASVRTVVPDIVPSLDLSSKVLASFNGRPFTPIPTPLPNLDTTKPKHHKLPPLQSKIHHQPPRNISNNNFKQQQSPEVSSNNHPSDSDRFLIDESGGPLSVVRSMVAVSLLQRVPFLRIDSSTVLRKLENDQSATAVEKAALRELGGESGAILAVEMALRSMAEDNGGVELEEFIVSGKSRVSVINIDRSRLVKELPESKQQYQQDDSSSISGGIRNPHQIQQVDIMNGGFVYGMPRPMSMSGDIWMGVGDPHLTGFPPPPMFHIAGRGRGMMPRPPMYPPPPPPKPIKSEEDEMKDLEILLSKKSFREMQKSKTGEELLDLIHRPTHREISNAAKFKSKGGSQVKEYCTALTKEDCRRQSGSYMACEKVHFRRIIALHTDVNLGDCSFLDTCRHMKTCKYVHYELDSSADHVTMMGNPERSLIQQQRAEYCSEVELGESQWINCDIRNFRMDILGQYGVIMADPPWDIHMELPYGTMADDEMRTLNVPALQTDGLIFLWVTGRAMELGRECLDLWGYKRVEEVIWVKTNQLQRIIRTGRTGHWLNHSKEHCLVGIKGNPIVNRNIDTDVIVAEVRETSRKPDEMYPLLERISPRTRKLELFARMHNTHAGWMSLGNQLNGVRLVDEGLRARFKAAYPEVEVQPQSPPRVVTSAAVSSATAMEVDNPFGGADESSKLSDTQNLLTTNPSI